MSTSNIKEAALLLTAIATLFAAITSAYIAINTREAVYQVHLSVNSRLDQLIRETEKSSFAEGKRQGEEISNEESD